MNPSKKTMQALENRAVTTMATSVAATVFAAVVARVAAADYS
jgi:hypothetical protein